MFRVGQKVVCVDDRPFRGALHWHGDKPVIGAIYTIRSIHIADDGDLVLRFNEIERSEFAKLEWCDPNLGYGAFRFRPIVERKTDISFAHEILRKATKQADTDIGASA